jgi:hypothetical protein
MRDKMMRRMPGLLALFLMGLALLAPQRASAVGETGARLKGRVLEAGTGIAVPGAKVEIRSDAMIGGARSVLTDDNGRFDFPTIPPGRYQIAILVEGIKPVRRSVVLLLGQTQDVDIPFSAELAQVETTIIDERVRLDPAKTSTGQVLTHEQQAKLATGRSYQSITHQVPGVTGGANPVMAGGSFRHNRYLVDGLDITDPVTNTFSANFNFDNIAQVEVLTVPMDARYNALGGVINLVTKRGSNKFEVDASFYFNHQALSAGGRAGTRLYEGRLLDQSDPRPPTARYQGNLNVGGPLLKDRIWFYASIEVPYTLRSVVPGPPLNEQHPQRTFIGVYPRLKLTFAPARKHRIEWSISADPAFISNLLQANTVTPEAEYHQNQGGFFTTLNYDYSITQNLLFSVQAGYQFSNLRITPENGDLLNSNHADQASTVVHNAAGAFRNQDDQRHRIQFDPMITWIKNGWAGSHTFTAGLQFASLRHYQLFSTPGNMTFADHSGQPGDTGLTRAPDSIGVPSTITCNPLQPYPLEGMGNRSSPCYLATFREPIQALVRTGWSLGGFIQDVWRPTSWLTLVPGFRIDYGRFSNSLGEVVQNVLGFGPRFGVAFRLTRDGKTLLKANYGRSNEVSTLLFAASADTGAAFSQWLFNRGTNRFDQYITSGGGADGYDLRGRCAPTDREATKECGNARLNLNPPHTDSVTVSLERELPLNVIGGITYTYRLHSWLWDDVELNEFRTLDGLRVAGFRDPSLGSVYGYRPVPGAWRRYNGIDFTLRKYPSPGSGWTAFIAYTLSFLDGTVDDQIGALYDDIPRNFRFRGFLADDRRHQIKAQATYTWRGLAVGAVLNYTSGGPVTRIYFAPDYGYIGRYGWRGVDPGYETPQGDPNDVRKWTELRVPDLMQIDVRAQYDLHALIRQHVSLIIDIFNTLDLSTPTGFENRQVATYSVVSNRLAPLQVQLGIRYQY